MRHCADQIDLLASDLEGSGDWDYVSEVMNSIRSLFSNLRLDLLVTRPVRELERELDDETKRNRNS